ncbi:MAG TPA: NADH-quinone oxidoreductase subunit L [Solirubrobacterales bacterium]|jgi:NADH-quinone oxidoreductase subunit L|nr:NADH-quinone oxidoreductase subunit L [Solirubrobacterales bacterium]
MSATTWAWLVLLLPLLGSLVVSLGYRAIPARVAGAIGTLAIGLAFLCAVAALVSLLGEAPEARHHASSLWTYAGAAGLDVKLGIYVDALSTFMILVVTGVSTLIHLYSVGYMKSDEGYHRFFAYLNFFVFSMLLLVLAGNFVLLIVGWAFVGFASYALISFWYRRTTATKAGMKAFVINVVGDIGLVLAAFLIFRELGTFDYGSVFAAAPHAFERGEWTVTAICLLLLVGAFAKSAQLPFHTWLPDAMEGPTPVSSLIHAATMVTAGVYLIARTHVLFYLAPTAADVGAFVGLATLLAAGTIAIAMTDLKRAIAYSTMSQIGYMIMGVSIGAYSAGLFHLMTHAFFKALLFMAAGSIISAMANRQDIDRMSGFWKAMRFTSLMLLIGGLALAAFPLTSGFFSKDSILAYAEARGGMYTWMAIGGYLGAFLTALYTFRLIFRVLPGEPCPEAQELIDTGHLHHGPPINPANEELEDAEVGFPGPEHHIAEQSWPMAVAMAVLGFGALFAGLIQIPGVDDVLFKFLEPAFADSPLAAIQPTVGAEWRGLATGGAISLLGIATAWLLWARRPELPALFRARLRPLYELAVNKWYFDEAIDLLVVRPALAIGRFANGTFERFVVEGLVSGTAETVRGAGGIVRVVQSGFVRSYALLLLAGFAGLALYFLLSSS